MNETLNPRIARIFSLGLLAGFATISMAVNDDGACGGGSVPATDTVTGSDGTSDTSVGPLQCRTAADCGASSNASDRVVCDGDWSCVDNMCQWSCEPPPPMGCYGAEDCGAGFECNASTVCRPPPGCEAGQVCPAVCYGECVPTGSEDACYSNDECARGQICDFSDCGGTPTALLACRGVCIDEVVETNCTSQDDCRDDELCACVPPGFFMPSARMACELQCVPRDAQCFNDMDCKAGYTCLDFQCVAAPTACWSNDECPRGWTCEDDCGAGAADPAEGDRIACPRSCKAPTTGSTCDVGGPECATGELCEETCWVEVADCDCVPGNDNCACPGSLVCVATCVPDGGWGECTSDVDCARGEACGCDPDAAGVCIPTCMPTETPYDCSSDADCGDGFCQIEVCEAMAPPPCDGGDCRPAPASCWGYCQPAYDCTADSDCREGGRCRLDENVCGFDPAAGEPLMPIACPGWCTYPNENACGPDGVVCGADEICEETWDCGTGSSERRPCWARYACVPAEGGCRSDDDCEGAALCVDGACEVQYCWDGVCPDGYDCNPGCGAIPALPNGLVVCPMVCEPAATACADDCDCNINEACVSGSCVEIAGANACRWIGCHDSTECAAGQECEVMCPLCLPDSPCPPCQGTCVGGASQCYGDADCARGEICDFSVAPLPADACDCVDCSCDPAARPMPAGTCVAAP